MRGRSGRWPWRRWCCSALREPRKPAASRRRRRASRPLPGRSRGEEGHRAGARRQPEGRLRPDHATVDVDGQGDPAPRGPDRGHRGRRYNLPDGATFPTSSSTSASVARATRSAAGSCSSTARPTSRSAASATRSPTTSPQKLTAPAADAKNGLTKTGAMFHVNPQDWQRDAQRIGTTTVAGVDVDGSRAASASTARSSTSTASCASWRRWASPRRSACRASSVPDAGPRCERSGRRTRAARCGSAATTTCSRKAQLDGPRRRRQRATASCSTERRAAQLEANLSITDVGVPQQISVPQHDRLLRNRCSRACPLGARRCAARCARRAARRRRERRLLSDVSARAGLTRPATRPRRPRAPRGRPRRATRTRARGCGGSGSSVRSMTAAMPRKPSSPLQERVDGDLVGGVQHARRGAARDRRRAREAEAREGVVVDGLERQRADLGEVEPPHRDVDAVGVVQRIGDRHAHVRVAEVRERRAVAERDHAVDDRLRVHDDVDALVRRCRTGGGPR